MTHLLDTNVVSELVKPSPHPAVVRYLQTLEASTLCWITVQEIAYGIARLEPGRRRSDLETFLSRLVSRFESRIVGIDRDIAHATARIRATREKLGRPIALADALIAATAFTCDLIVVTRNVVDFEGIGLQIENPWQS